jgi:3-oxoacyl-[acyl-carrier protein] reductase
MKKNILLTGDSRGLGLNTRKVLESKGYNVIGVSRNSPDIKFDLNDVDYIKELYLKEIKPLGPIHGYVNNAAYAYDDIITNLNPEKLKHMFNINVFSPMMLTKYVIRDMILNKVKGSIVHVSSISVHTGYKGLSMYASSKGSLEAFSKNTSREWGRMGIRSNVVCPGFMDTDMSSSLSEDDKRKIFNRNSLFKELEKNDVSNTISFLISKESKGITGQVIHVDNGTI